MKALSKKALIALGTIILLLVILISWKGFVYSILTSVSPNCSTYEDGKQIEQCSCLGFESVLNETLTESGYQFTTCIGYVSSVKNLEE